MTTFVITVPGTFTGDVADTARDSLRRRLLPQHSQVSEDEGLDLLTVNDDDTFCVRLEVEAADRYEAELDAVRTVERALADTGIASGDAPLGPPAVTGIDSDI
ncbi:hypothetical protein ABT160_29380 [Streptomyces sp. NPDC001941]|uniref:hypothetical protein n=1 Tax=Streptomyces sp. NPDC001941 TaxID=3154659 RepID=UPI0033323F4F